MSKIDKKVIADACFQADIPTIESAVSDILEVAALMAVDAGVDVQTYVQAAAKYYAMATGKVLERCDVEITMWDRGKVS
jgi:hypothetical protein